MRIVFYSTFVSMFPTILFPLRDSEWESIARENPDHEFIVVTFPGNFMLRNPKEQLEDRKVKMVDMEEYATNAEYIEAILAQKPDLAVSIPTPAVPCDWNPLRDATIAEMLEADGIKTIAQSDATAIVAFDKFRTSMVLGSKNFPIADNIYVQGPLFFHGRINSAVVYNAYKEYIYNRIKRMNYPLIFKSSTGIGSLGIRIVRSFEEAKEVLRGESITDDFMVEQFLEGDDYGTEIHGCKGNYTVLPPVRYYCRGELNDPQKSVKFGPYTGESMHIKELQEMLLRLADEMDIVGIAQVDLKYCNGEWYIIEINPRWSGSTILTTSIEGRRTLDVFADLALGKNDNYSDFDKLKYSVSFKISGTTDELEAEMFAQPHVNAIAVSDFSKANADSDQIEATSEFSGAHVSEVVMGGFDNTADIIPEIEKFNAKFNGIISSDVIEMLKDIIPV